MKWHPLETPLETFHEFRSHILITNQTSNDSSLSFSQLFSPLDHEMRIMGES